MAGGDLDGDVYFATWNKEIVQEFSSGRCKIAMPHGYGHKKGVTNAKEEVK